MIRKFVLAFGFLFVFLFGGQANAAFVDPLQDACQKVQQKSSVCQENSHQAKNGNQDPIGGSNGILQAAANIMALITGVAAVIIIIISGLNFVTAGGNAEKSKKARSTLTAAIIGLIIVALAWTFITFVVQKLIQ